LVRVRALARRPQSSYQAEPPTVLRFADIEMNLERKEFLRGGQRILLTPREFALMEYLLRNPERAISKAEISERVWNLSFDTGTNFVEVYFNFLRKKVDRGFPKKLIHTQFRTGYEKTVFLPSRFSKKQNQNGLLPRGFWPSWPCSAFLFSQIAIPRRWKSLWNTETPQRLRWNGIALHSIWLATPWATAPL
ncbi:MAG: winged helix-turn-helix domain-containing protein, partial [Saprospiraceae bacterium]